MVSTNGKYHNHPDKEILGRIINFNKNNEIELIFNYKIPHKNMFSKEDKLKYQKFKCETKNIVEL